MKVTAYYKNSRKCKLLQKKLLVAEDQTIGKKLKLKTTIFLNNCHFSHVFPPPPPWWTSPPRTWWMSAPGPRPPRSPSARSWARGRRRCKRNRTRGRRPKRKIGWNYENCFGKMLSQKISNVLTRNDAMYGVSVFFKKKTRHIDSCVLAQSDRNIFPGHIATNLAQSHVLGQRC